MLIELDDQDLQTGPSPPATFQFRRFARVASTSGMEIVRDCIAAGELNTAVPIDPPICWAVLSIADAMPASWDWPPLVAAFCAGPKIGPHPRPMITPDIPVIGEVAPLSGVFGGRDSGGYGSDPQDFAGLE
jgi:hypothetical protein